MKTTYEAYSEMITSFTEKATQVSSEYIRSIWLRKAHQAKETRSKLTVKEAETPWTR
jgi:hypothetical protein